MTYPQKRRKLAFDPIALLNTEDISQKFKANGKLLLTGEYFVLDGAKALALPVRMGQWMHVRESTGSEVVWNSHDVDGNVWFKASFDLLDFEPSKTNDEETAQTLRQILKEASRLDSDFLSKWKKYRIDTYLEFDRNWGLGSSSTLISCLAQWADVNPYMLLFNSLGGSGYDVACAQAEGPILYQLGTEQLNIEHVEFEPSFGDKLYFVYLGAKMNTSDARKHYYKHRANSNGTLQHITDISEQILKARSLTEFEKLITEHERLISTSLHLKTVKEERFSDYWGAVKSLGAWGGDFALATSDRDETTTRAYFQSKGHDTVFALDEIVLKESAS